MDHLTRLLPQDRATDTTVTKRDTVPDPVQWDICLTEIARLTRLVADLRRDADRLVSNPIADPVGQGGPMPPVAASLPVQQTWRIAQALRRIRRMIVRRRDPGAK